MTRERLSYFDRQLNNDRIQQ